MNNNLSKIKHYLKRIKHYSGNWKALIRYIFFVFGRFGNAFSPTGKRHKARHKEKLYNKITEGKDEIKKEILGNEMILPVEDKGLSKDLILSGIRELEVLNLMKWLEKEKSPLIDKNSNVIEIGANIGYYALMWGRIINKGNGFLYAIEPNPSCFKYLKKNIKLNNIKRVKLMNLGVSDSKKPLLFRTDGGWNNTRVIDLKEKKPRDISISSDCLDNLFRNKKDINLIRMDVEGHEYQILKGAKNFLKNNRNLKIFMEFHGHRLTSSQKKEIIKILKDSGFKLKCYTDTKLKTKQGKNLNILNTFIHVPHLLFVKEKAKEKD